MNMFLCNTLVREESNEHYLGYVLYNNSYFYNTLYQIVKKSSGEFLECYKLLQNGMIKVIYDVNEYRTFNAVVSHFTEEQFIKVISSFVLVIKKIKNKGFVQLETIALDIDKIFIDTEDCTVRFVCVPLNIMSTWETQEQFDKNAASALAMMIYNSDFIDIPCLYQIFIDCKEEKVGFQEIYNRMLAGHYGNYFSIMQTEELKESAVPADLALESVQENTVILINKSRFVVGKDKESVDFAISDSTKISRVHCEVIYQDGQFYITDKKSTNGTYVNGTRIPSERLIPIQTGDRIILADKEYVVR